MKIRIFLENDNGRDDCYVDAEFPCAPRVDEFVVVDWSEVAEYIIKNDLVKDFTEYLYDIDLVEWFKNPEARKTMRKPTKKQIRSRFYIESVGIVKSVSWIVNKDREADCRIWVSPY